METNARQRFSAALSTAREEERVVTLYTGGASFRGEVNEFDGEVIVLTSSEGAMGGMHRPQRTLILLEMLEAVELHRSKAEKEQIKKEREAKRKRERDLREKIRVAKKAKKTDEVKRLEAELYGDDEDYDDEDYDEDDD